MIEKIRIKDIAARSGVSVGTVDRVLHGRPNVSKVAREKVEKVLSEINYQPNMYASALASNRRYVLYAIIPEHDSEAYWEEIEEGLMNACAFRRDFHISVEIRYYKLLDHASLDKAFNEVTDSGASGVIIVPTNYKEMHVYTDRLHQLGIPFILLDSYIKELEPLSFYGQDPVKSGFFAARMLMLLARGDKEIMQMKQTKDGKTASRQQRYREMGFRQYMENNFPKVKIRVVDLPLTVERKAYDNILDEFFDSHPRVRQCITMGSKAHLVGDYLLRKGRRGIQIMGYDMVGKNAACLRKGSISFLIAQHAFVQGYKCVDSLFQAIVLKQPIAPVNYMPIELLSRENVDFYHKERM